MFYGCSGRSVQSRVYNSNGLIVLFFIKYTVVNLPLSAQYEKKKYQWKKHCPPLVVYSVVLLVL